MLWVLIAASTVGMLSCSSDKPAKGDGDMPVTDDSAISDGDEIPSDDELLVPDEGYPSPEPDTCAFIGANCGEVLLDGGKKLSCGECTDPDTCGGGGTPNVCGHQLCDEGWCWEHPYPQGDDLNDIYALDATHVWAVGDSVAIFYNGVSWERIPYQLRQGGNIQAIYAADADHVWAVATDGCILFLNEEGLLTCDREIDEDGFPTHWTDNENALYDIHGTGPNDIWAVGDHIVLHWDGVEWKRRWSPSNKINAVWAIDATTVYVGGEKTLLRYDGSTWNEERDEEIINDIFAVTPGDIWAVGKSSDLSNGIIMHYAGGVWKKEPARDSSVTAVGGLGSGQIVIGDEAGRLIRKWPTEGMELAGHETLLPLNNENHRIAAVSSAAGVLWFVARSGLIGSWDTKFLTTNRPRLPSAAQALFANSPFDVWTAGNMFFGHYNGTTWQFMATEESITDLYGSAYNDIYAETTDGYLHYDGARWSDASPDEATVMALKAARDEFFSRPDEETVRWCFVEKDCWEIFYTYLLRETNNELTGTHEWPFGGLPSSKPVPTAPVFACATTAGHYWVDDGFHLIHFNGDQWRTFNHGAMFDSPEATAVTCDGDTVWAADYYGWIWFVSGNTALSVAQIEEGDIEILDRSVEGTLYAMTDIEMGNGVLYRILNHSAEKVMIPGDPPLLSLAAIADDDIWVGGANALYHWDGTEWTTTLPADLTDRGLPTGETEVNLTRIFALDAENIWMLGASPDGATAYIFSYDGTKWVNDARTSLYGELAFTDVWATDQENAYITMNAEGWVYHYKNLGAAGMIDYVAAPAGTPFTAIAGRAGEEMRIFAPGGAILRYDF